MKVGIECLSNMFMKFRDRWVSITTAWRVLRLRMEERPADIELSCEYIEEAVADSRQGVVLQVVGNARR